MNRITSGALLQYLGIILVLGAGWWEWGARLADPPRPGVPTAVWVLVTALVVIGSTIRVMSGDPKPRLRNESLGLTPSYANDEDALTLTPEMFDELRAARPWVKTFAVILTICTILLYLGSIATLVGSFFVKDRSSSLMIAGTAALYAALATLYLTLLEYVRQHKSALEAAGRGVSAIALRNVVDSQRRILRYFGVVLCAFGVLAFIAILGAIAAGASAWL